MWSPSAITVKKVGSQPLQIDSLAPDLEFAFHQSIVAVEVHDELSIGAARHGKISVPRYSSSAMLPRRADRPGCPKACSSS